jgi:flagellar basal-body rod modification protein FlgD
MSTINATSSLTGSLASTTSTAGTTAMGKDDFLKLLTTQLQNQNPLEPMDNTAYVAQLAQFSSLEQMQNMNSNLATSILLNQSVNNSLATSLIGRDIQSRGDQLTHVSSDKQQLDFTLGGAAAKVKVEVVDANGKVVATLEPGAMSSGSQSVTWDGKETDGSTAPAGDYTFRVSATDAKGAAVSSQTTVTGRVTGVKFDNGNTYLMIGGRKVSMADIIQIAEAGTKG